MFPADPFGRDLLNLPPLPDWHEPSLAGPGESGRRLPLSRLFSVSPLGSSARVIKDRRAALRRRCVARRAFVSRAATGGKPERERNASRPAGGTDICGFSLSPRCCATPLLPSTPRRWHGITWGLRLQPTACLRACLACPMGASSWVEDWRHEGGHTYSHSARCSSTQAHRVRGARGDEEPHH